MALNPFFQQGTAGEQRLIQDLVNEHLQFHGVDVTYIPRKFINRKTIIEEVQTSKFVLFCCLYCKTESNSILNLLLLI